MKIAPSFKEYIRLLIIPLICLSLSLQADDLLTKARAGDAEAQLELGNLYFYGNDKTPKAYPRAISWYRKALKNGNKAAAFNLAICYDAPYGVKRDLEKAKEFYLIAIENGVKPALLNYALILTELNRPREAKRYLQLAANENIGPAARLYALTLPEGEARLSFLKKASDLGDPKAMLLLADHFERKKNLDKMISLLKKSAALGNPEAMLKLGFCYQTNYGIAKNEAKARDFYKSAAQQGKPLAAIEFGKILLKEGKPELAYKYFSYASRSNNPIGMFMKGVCLNGGIGTNQNKKEAFLLFEKAAKMGYVKAQYNTGLAFEQGNGVEASITMAQYWYEQAIKQDDIQSYLSLAEFYYYGASPIKKDRAKAIRYLKLAKKLGSDEATRMIKQFTETTN